MAADYTQSVNLLTSGVDPADLVLTPSDVLDLSGALITSSGPKMTASFVLSTGDLSFAPIGGGDGGGGDGDGGGGGGSTRPTTGILYPRGQG